jgi:YVTN family beta-propeller protein
LGQTAGPPLVLEAKIPLGAVSGRIDHLAIDLKRQRLLVAELGNNSLGVVDLAAHKVLRTITGLSEPQGVGYEPGSDTVYVANAGDGSVRVLRGEDLAPVGRVELGEDADNVRVDAPRKEVLVGYGKGALAIIDSTNRAKTGDIRLSGHPEGFQIAENGTQIFVNVPDFHEIAIVDRAKGAVQSVSTGGSRSNFPIAVDPEAHRVLAVFRSPPTLMALTSPEGRIAAKLATCGDADDVFVDARRRRIYVSCGEGVVDVIEPREGAYARVAQVTSVAGARTALFVPELDRLYVAVRARGAEPAAIWVFRPAP